MKIDSTAVAITRCSTYDLHTIRQAVTDLFDALSFSVAPGTKILLKPNLVSAMGHDGLACTHAHVIAAAAQWFLDHDAHVTVGDSPAFGNARRVMTRFGIKEALKGMDVTLDNMTETRKITLANGVSAKIAVAALDCDLLINLPKVKAHSQMLVSLGVKNLFGVVTGWQKPWIHIRHGKTCSCFATVLADLLHVLPDGITLIDAITAMHKTGPVAGSPYPLGLLAAATNPVALDTAFLDILKIDPAQSPLWRECLKRKLTGTSLDAISWPGLLSNNLQVNDFIVPEVLKPINFHPVQIIKGSLKRLLSKS